MISATNILLSLTSLPPAPFAPQMGHTKDMPHGRSVSVGGYSTRDTPLLLVRAVLTFLFQSNSIENDASQKV